MNEAKAHDALFQAIDRLDAGAVQLSLREGASARMPRGLLADNHDKQTPLAALWAAWTDERSPSAEAILTHLLDAGAFGTGRGVSGAPILIEAVRTAPDGALPFIIRALCGCGATIDAGDLDGINALTHAAGQGRNLALNALLDAGANPDTCDRSGRTALMRALEEGQGDTARALLARGADPDETDADGACALLRLARGHVDAAMVELLLGFHADPNLPDRDGRTPLLECASRGDIETSALLLRAGARAWQADRNGTTPLMEAARAGKVPLEAEQLEALVAHLIQARAAPDATDNKGESAWQRLLTHHRTDLIDAWKEGLARGWVEQHPRLDDTSTRRLVFSP